MGKLSNRNKLTHICTFLSHREQMKIGDIVKLVELEDVTDCVGGCLYYKKGTFNTTCELVYDSRYPSTKPPFGKKMVIVKIEEKMSPNSIAVSPLNRKNDWKYWSWIPEEYIKEIL